MSSSPILCAPVCASSSESTISNAAAQMRLGGRGGPLSIPCAAKEGGGRGVAARRQVQRPVGKVHTKDRVVGEIAVDKAALGAVHRPAYQGRVAHVDAPCPVIQPKGDVAIHAGDLCVNGQRDTRHAAAATLAGSGSSAGGDRTLIAFMSMDAPSGTTVQSGSAHGMRLVSNALAITSESRMPSHGESADAPSGSHHLLRAAVALRVATLE